jgi:hypothetical protein
MIRQTEKSMAYKERMRVAEAQRRSEAIGRSNRNANWIVATFTVVGTLFAALALWMQLR